MNISFSFLGNCLGSSLGRIADMVDFKSERGKKKLPPRTLLALPTCHSPTLQQVTLYAGLIMRAMRNLQEKVEEKWLDGWEEEEGWRGSYSTTLAKVTKLIPAGLTYCAAGGRWQWKGPIM